MPIVVLFWCDPSDGNEHYGDDDGKWEPRVLCLDLSEDGDCDDSSVSRYGEEHCADRLSLYLKFHPLK